MAKFRVLYVNGTEECREAERALQQYGLDFQPIVIDNPAREEMTVPRLHTSEGYFTTLEDIRWYAAAYCDKRKRTS